MFKKLMQRVDRLLGRGVIDDQLYDELEEELLAADTHIETVGEILEELRTAVRTEKITAPEAMKERLKEAISRRIDPESGNALLVGPSGPTVYIFVGVNGVGKTTSIAKVAHRLRRQGHSVILAAGDTFRAAAIEQLSLWAQRVGCEIVKSQPGGDSAAVVFDAIQAARARGISYVLADTAGRQHSKESLMLELGKVITVATKANERPPDEVLLVLDANTGQNAIRQGEVFQQVAGVTGLILTKVDGTARGGAILGVFDRLKLPIKLVGMGESMDDLRDFSPKEFAEALFDD